MTKFLPAEPRISLAFASCLSGSVSGIALNSYANFAAFNFLEAISGAPKLNHSPFSNLSISDIISPFVENIFLIHYNYDVKC